MKIDTKLISQQGIYMLHIKEHMYIGSSVNIYHRLVQHSNALLHNKHENPYLQNAYNKYGSDSLWYEVLEICQDLSDIELRTREMFYIQEYNSDLNLRKDPVTCYNCTTTSIPVYQYDYEGNLIKVWPSAAEAGRFYKMDQSNINFCCTHPPIKRRKAKGFLWAREYPYPFKINPPILIYDLDGNFVNKYPNLTSAAQDLFKDKKLQSTRNSLQARLDTNKPYLGYYITTNTNFVVTDQMKKRYKKETALDKILKSNPMIYIYDRSNNLIGQDYLKNLPHHNNIAQSIRNGTNFTHSLFKYDPNIYYGPTKVHKCLAQDLFSGEIYIYDTKKAAAVDLFGDERFRIHIGKHIKYNTPFRGYKFRDL